MEDYLSDLNIFFEMDKKYEKYRPRLLKSNETLFNMDDFNEKVKIIKGLYAYVKKISVEFYVEERKEFVCLQNLVQLLKYCEDSLDNEYIIDVTTNVNGKKSVEKVREIVYLTRKSILEVLTKNGRYHHSFDFYNLENYCEISCDETLSICNEMSIKCFKIKMLNGFANNLELFNGQGFHCFTILEINEVRYLVDCTYKQFFLLKMIFVKT